MYNVGDLVINSSHGICQIDNICEKTYSGTTRTYYVMHPVEDDQLTISIPVDNKKGIIQSIISRDIAEEILQTFKNPGINWVEKSHDRNKMYADIVKTGDRYEVAKVINTLLRKKHDVEQSGKKLGESEKQLLLSTKTILFRELSISLETPLEVIIDEIHTMMEIED